MSPSTDGAASAATKFIVDLFAASTVNPVYLSSLANADAPASEPKERHVTTRAPADIEAFIRKWDRKHRGLYVCVSTLAPGATRRAKETASELTGLHCDIDFKSVTLTSDEIKQKLRKLALLLSKIIHSGNGFHCYWHFREALPATPENIAMVEKMLRQLADYLGGDPAVCEIARLMRLPGTHNTKAGAWNEVAVISEMPARYDPDELVEWLNDLSWPLIARKPANGNGPSPDNPFLELGAQATKPPIDIEARLAAMRHEGPGDTSIHQTQLQLSAALLNRGYSVDETVKMLLEATRRAAGDAGEKWNWQDEADAIRGMCSDWLVKHPEAGQPTENYVAPQFSDEALALHFAEQYAGNLRHVAAWSRWLRWDGKRWLFDDTLFAFDLARAVCRHFAELPKAPAAKITSARTVASVVTLARADRRLAATIGQWDADPWLLNTPTGIVDLRTGIMRPNDPAQYMTKLTSVTPGGDCPRWLEFLDRITDRRIELQAFLKRLFGYSLTGVTSEHAMFFLYGRGANGKSVFVGTFSGILADYHRTTPIETFTASSVDRHPTELADLRGARGVTAVETEEGRRWAESRIKTLTGGDKIAARFMRQDFFEYTPAFKLLIAGNHKPSLRSVDEAIRRRFNLIPFSVTIPPRERDKQLSEKLRAEWPGILRWAIEGCLEWQRVGLDPPRVVTEATEQYLEAEDAVVTWMDECGERNPNAWQSRTELFVSWMLWAEKNGEHAGSRKRFLENLEARGLVPARSADKRRERGLRGLRLLSAYSDAYQGS